MLPLRLVLVLAALALVATSVAAQTPEEGEKLTVPATGAKRTTRTAVTATALVTVSGVVNATFGTEEKDPKCEIDAFYRRCDDGRGLSPWTRRSSLLVAPAAQAGSSGVGVDGAIQGSFPPFRANHDYNVRFRAPYLGKLIFWTELLGSQWQYSGGFFLFIKESTVETGCKRTKTDPRFLQVRVSKITPHAEYRCAGMAADEWLELTHGTLLQQGDEINVDPDGAVLLKFADKSTVLVRNTTQLKISSFFSEGGVVRTELLLKMGEVAATVNKSQSTRSDFRVKSPGAVSSVRGTVFSVFGDIIGKASVVTVAQGLVSVDPTGAGATKNVPAGKEVEVTSAGVSAAAPIGLAGAPPKGVNRSKARALALKLVAMNDERCKLEATAVSTKRNSAGWLVSIRVVRSGNVAGWSTWQIAGKTAVPVNPLAQLIANGCT